MASTTIGVSSGHATVMVEVPESHWVMNNFADLPSRSCEPKHGEQNACFQHLSWIPPEQARRTDCGASHFVHYDTRNSPAWHDSRVYFGYAERKVPKAGRIPDRDTTLLDSSGDRPNRLRRPVERIRLAQSDNRSRNPSNLDHTCGISGRFTSSKTGLAGSRS